MTTPLEAPAASARALPGGVPEPRAGRRGTASGMAPRMLRAGGAVAEGRPDGPRDVPGRVRPGRGTPRGAGGEAPPDEAAGRALDHELIRRAQRGDERAFEDLVRRHQARAWRVARGMVGGDEDAADLAQEAFLRVFRNLEGFDFQHGFTTWLHRIVSNLAIDHLRRRRPALSTARRDEDEGGEFELVDPRSPRPAEGLELAEQADEVRACLAALAPHFQSVLVLREMEGLPCTEIATIVGATHVTVRWRLHRGRKLFQEEWERRQRLREAGANPSPPPCVPHPGLGEAPGGEPGPVSKEDPRG